ncbi:MAG: zinc protease [Chlamydiales bacterium]|jgi:zinc protease
MHASSSALLPLFLAAAGLASCSSLSDTKPDAQSDAGFAIDFEKYVLDNGLEVILHEDHSDPIVAVATLVHVGSNREKPGRTGFAHFFEHMSFNDSENVPVGANRKYIPELGGSRNGGTWTDGTVYYEVVPTDAFEKILWIDSDRLGFMINTVTDAALNREKQVVKNEKRQRTDNAPYGHTDEVIRHALYPSDHPYSWTVIGSLADLQSATLEDVKEFYVRYYGAGNATLVIAGDIDVQRTKELVERWFGEIDPGPPVEALEARHVQLSGSRSLFHEDNFAKLPELRMVFPTVEQFHADSYALSILGTILAGSKRAALYNVVVEQHQLAPGVSATQSSSELTGQFIIRVRANAGSSLTEVKTAIDEALEEFARNGCAPEDLERVKAQQERGLYDDVSTVLNKAFQLANNNVYAGDPGYITQIARRTQEVTANDVERVFQRYIHGQPFVMTSFVPKGQAHLAVEGAERADVREEVIQTDVASEEVSQGTEAVYERTPSRYDRSEPPLGAQPLLSMPKVWHGELANGVQVHGIEQEEVPLVTYDLTFKGGHWLDGLERAGTASLLSSLMLQGTRARTPIELEEAIDLLGADISITAGAEEMRISVNTLARNFDATTDLVEEILLEPRWDVQEYERLKRELETRLRGREASPTAISAAVYQRLLYGKKHILATPVAGTLASAERISLDDLKAYYATNLSPSMATVHVVGAVDKDSVLTALSGLAERWQGDSVDLPAYALTDETADTRLYFIDVPGSKQSVLRIGRLALSRDDPSFNQLICANQTLGGGSSGRLFQQMRIDKGWTYGAYSFVGQTLEVAPFTAYSSVRSNVTLPSLQLMRDLIRNYGATFGADEMAVTKNQRVKGNTRAFESAGAKMGILRQMSKYGLEPDYLEQEQSELLNMELADFHGQIGKHMDEASMIYLVVGDAATQLAEVEKLGLGPACLLDIHGGPLEVE